MPALFVPLFSIVGAQAAGTRFLALVPLPQRKTLGIKPASTAPTSGALDIRVAPVIPPLILPDLSVTNGKLANMARGRLKAGGASIGGPASDLDVSAAGVIPIGNGTDVAAHALSGDVVMDAAGVVTVRFSGKATFAHLNFPWRAIADAAGNLYIADSSNSRVRRVDAASGIISSVAGTGVAGYTGDGDLAVLAQLSYPSGMAFDAAGNLFIADVGTHTIRKVDVSTGIITTVAGTGISGFSGDGDAAVAAKLDGPSGIAVDGSSNLFIADVSNNRVRRVDAATGDISTYAGDGDADYDGDADLATLAGLNAPSDVSLDGSSNLFIADTGNHCIREVTIADGKIATVAGTGGASGYTGDTGLATAATLYGPKGVVVDAVGNLFIADTLNHSIRKVDVSTGNISTVAGYGFSGTVTDGVLATSSCLQEPIGITVDPAGDFFIADSDDSRIRRVDAATQIITTVAGDGTAAYGGDGGLSHGQIAIGDVNSLPQPQRIKGDATLAADGTLTLANGAGVAALLTAGLGGSGSVLKTDAVPVSLVSAHPTKARACIVMVTVDETYDIGTGTLPTVQIGEDDNPDACMADTVLTDQIAGTVLFFQFLNTATKAITVTPTAAVGDATGGCGITVLCLPTT